jgi:Bacterial capsule synthesis protein PGA_cap
MLVVGALLGTAGLPNVPSPESALTEPAGAAGASPPVLGDPTGNVVTVGEQLGSGRAVTLAFGGDVHFEGVLATRLASHPHTFLDPAKALFAGADLVMVNLESAVTTRGSPEPKQFTFRAPSSALGALKAAGITVVTQANNHGEDYGSVGLADSIAAAKRAGFPVIGIGFNVTEAFAPYRTTIDGQRIAIIAATQVLDDNLRDAWTATDTHAGVASAYDTDHLLAAVRQARSTADTVVVYVHWGTEAQNCPNQAQPPLARLLVDAGADIIVGSHAHVLLGAGRLGRALVDYGLGNFAFYATGGAQIDSGVLKVTVTGRRVDSYQWIPARIADGIPRPLHGSAAATAAARWAGHRSCTDLAA